MSKTVKEYYTRAPSIYREVFGEQPHFGYYPIFGMENSIKLAESQNLYTEEFADYICTSIPLHKRGQTVDVLELCCGQGHLWRCLDDRGILRSYVGVDFTGEYLDEFRVKLAEREGADHRTELVEANVNDFLRRLAEGARTGIYDFVVIQDSFYHLDNKEESLQYIYMLLRNGGFLVLSDLHIEATTSRSKDWNEHFVARQGQSKPTEFSAKKSRWYTLTKKKEITYNFSRLAGRNGFILLNHTDMTRSMELTYKRAISDATNTYKLHQYSDVIESFRFLQKTSKEGNYRLGWWRFSKPIKQSISPSNYIDVSIGPAGFGYDNKGILLHECHFSVMQGEYVVIIGETGSGKSSLLNLIIGALKSNTVTVDIKEAVRIAHVEQNPSLIDGIVVEKLLEFIVKGASDLPVSEKPRRVYELLYMTKLLHVADHLVGELSGGQRQRVALAAALASSPDVLLVDEPVSSQDGASSKIVLKILEEFNSTNNNTVIHVTHRYDEINNLEGKSIYEISHGQIFEVNGRELIGK